LRSSVYNGLETFRAKDTHVHLARWKLFGWKIIITCHCSQTILAGISSTNDVKRPQDCTNKTPVSYPVLAFTSVKGKVIRFLFIVS
jgi:hypothetical protein